MSPSTVYLSTYQSGSLTTLLIEIVTGAGRGIGIGFVEKLVSNPDNVIFAGLRDTNLASDHPLSQLIAKNPERIFLLRVSSASEEDNAAAAEIIKEQYGKVDVIIANAGRPEMF
jgi:NAD(P)-dependent dehydrogenase (short-subunit alcohol dehydrogenase family)